MTRRRLGVLVLFTILLLAGVSAWWFFLRSDGPEAANIEKAAKSVKDTSAPDTGVEGRWIIDPSQGKSEGGTFGGYRVDEELAGVGHHTVVGRSKDVDARLTIQGTTVAAAKVTVNLEELETDDPRRDGRARRALEIDEFPAAVFELKSPIDFHSVPAGQEEISVKANGTFRIHGVTRDTEVSIEARRVGNTIVIVGSAPVRFSDYGIEMPSAPIVLSLEEQGEIEFQLFLKKA